jgi:hypothetical protein
VESSRLRTFLSTEFVQNLELAHMRRKARDGCGGAPLCLKSACPFFAQPDFIISFQ